jgi:multidrug resistance efflux pump
MRRVILVAILIPVIIIAAAAGAAYWVYNNYYYYTTDDAQVNGQLVNISSMAPGQLATFSAKTGDKVTVGQTIATITVANATGGGTHTIPVTSPISGTIVQTSAVPGQGVVAGLSLAQVTNLNNVDIIAYVDENSIDNVKLNQTVDVTVDAYKGTTYAGRVQQIVQTTAGEFSLLPTEDNASGNFTKVSQRIPVLISLDGTSGTTLMPGMSAEVTIHIR